MIKEAILHFTYGNYAYPVAKDTLRVRLRAARGDLQRAVVLYEDRYPGTPLRRAGMVLKARDELFDYFQADLRLQTGRFAYVFFLDDGNEPLFYTEKGFRSSLEPQQEFHYPYLTEADLWEPPRWAQGAVFYQIFPDRFAKSAASRPSFPLEPWEAPPTVKGKKGGDLAGVLEHLDHLKKLGIDAIYFTPLFQAGSNHKYDTADYYMLDPAFGTEETLRTLIGECHKAQIRVIFDAVFNHSGTDFFAFQDVLKRGEDSPYVHWFNIKSFPVQTSPPNYETFGTGHAYLPKLITTEPDLQEYFYKVGLYWLKEFGIDGWRLDVANEVDREFWRGFRRVIKAENPEALIIGEIWHDAGQWLWGDQFDCVFNYSLYFACLDYFAKGKIRADTFAHRLARILINQTEAVNRSLFTLLGTHDTERFLTACEGDQDKFALAVAFQMTFSGAPLIYYGDEVGMEGANDPDCRRGMIWDPQRQNQRLLRWYQRLIDLRKKHSPLKMGDVSIVWADPITNLLGFVRHREGQQILVLLNNSSRPVKCSPARIDWPCRKRGEFVDLWDNSQVDQESTITIPGFGVRILG